MRMTIMAIVALAVIATPATAHFPAECADELNFLAMDGMTTQKWKSEDVSLRTRELLEQTDLIRLRSWAAYVDANQQYLAQTMMAAIRDVLMCISDGSESEGR